MACSYKPPYRRLLRLKAFLAHLQTWDTINPTNKTPPKASSSEDVLERNLSAERAAYGTSCTQPQG